jgi:glycosyltransferase involved in cell wall biosynthesis
MGKTRNILFISDVYEPINGGLVTSLKRILIGLSSISKDNIHLLTPSCEDAENGSVKLKEGFTLHRYGDGELESGYLYVPFMIKQVKKLHDIHSFDVIIAFYANYPLLIAGTCHEYLKIPYIICARGSDVNVNLLNPWRRKILSDYFSKADLTICNSEDMVDRIVAWKLLPKDKVTCIRNSIDVTTIPTVQQPVNYDFLFVGFTKPVKRFDSIISALDILKKKGIKAKLGALLIPHKRHSDLLSSYKETCQSLGLSGYIDFIEPISRDECIKLFSKAKSVLVPSDSEGCSNIILEGMAAGCRVIARSTSIPKHLIGTHNIIFNNDNELAKAMIKVAKHSATMIMENRELVHMSHQGKIEFKLYSENIDLVMERNSRGL